MNYPKPKLSFNNKGKKDDNNKKQNTDEKEKEKNIFDCFIFGEDKDEEDNVVIISKLNKKEKSNSNTIEENKDNNNKKIKYKVKSFITTNRRPDLYSPLGIIGGNKYNLMNYPNQKNESEEIEADDKEENDAINEEDEKGEEFLKDSEIVDKKEDGEKKELDKYKLLKLGRYFVLDEDITVKCYNCGEVGHVKDNCPFTSLKFCHRCLSQNHNDKDCKNKKCFRSNRFGYNKNDCDIKESDLLICFNCHNIGHRKNECLINPLDIDSKFIKQNNLSCFNCGSPNHLICPFLDREDIELTKDNNFDESEDEKESSNREEVSSETPMEEEENIVKKKSISKKKKNARIFDDLKNEEIKYTIFCSFCGERHTNEYCSMKNDPKFSNEFDIFRKNICKRIFEKRQKESEEKQKVSSLQKKRSRDNSYKNSNISFNKSNDTRNISFNYNNRKINNINNINEFLQLREDEDVNDSIKKKKNKIQKSNK